jgi:predicted nucleotidyltransferase
MVSMKDIRAAAERIGRNFRPHKVILFGSYAYGTPAADSDVDLLVIMPCRGHPVHKAVEILTKAKVRFPVDLLVRTPSEVRKRLAWNDFFIREIMEKGKVLYAADDRRVGGQGEGPTLNTQCSRLKERQQQRRRSNIEHSRFKAQVNGNGNSNGEDRTLNTQCPRIK